MAIRASQWQQALVRARRPLIASQFVLVEIADGLSTIGYRGRALRVLDALSKSSFVEIVDASSRLYSEALDLYRNREDKEWG